MKHMTRTPAPQSTRSSPPFHMRVATRPDDRVRERKQLTSPTTAPLAYRIQEAARVLGVGKTTLYQLFKAGALKPIRIGGRTLVPADQLRQLIAEAQPALNSK